MIPIKTPCPRPVICWTCCYRRTLAQALAQPPQALGHQAQAPLGPAQGPLDQGPMAAALLEVELVSA